MKLPAVDRAVIEPAKIQDYLLSTSHPVGRFKAPFFISLGYTSSDWHRLEADLRDLAILGDAEPGQDSPYGQKYQIRGTLTGPAGKSANVVTVWIILSGGDVPQFVTAFPGEIE
ncbi:MAG: adhesin [candidate division NC10 bacterium]|nr:adhesin [candidate division NC10 bacterium]